MESAEVTIGLGNMDWGLLRRQKQELANLVPKRSLTLNQREAIEGILHLIDHIQDETVNTGQLTVGEVFNAEMPENLTD
jgi:hypothetical protein